MKKSLIAISAIAILSISYCAASWYTGNIIENKMDQSMSKLINAVNQQQNIAELQMQYSNYHKGIFSSTFDLTISINKKADLQQHQIIFSDNVTLNHGPFPLKQLFSGYLKPVMAALSYRTSQESNPTLWQAANHQPFINLDIFIDYNSNIKINANNQPLTNYLDQNGSTINVSSGKLALIADKNFNQLSLNATLPHFLLENEAIKFDVNQIEFVLLPLNDQANLASELHIDRMQFLRKQVNEEYQIININYDNVNYLNDSGLILNNALSIDHITLHRENQLLQLNQFTGKNIAELSEQDANLHTELKIGNALFGKQNLGSGELSFTINSQPNDYITYFYPLLNNSLQRHSDQLHNLDINIDKLQWQTAQGDIEANMSAILKGNKLLTLIKQGWLDETHLNHFEAEFNIPFRTLGYIVAQLTYSEQEQIIPQQLNDSEQNMRLLAQILLSHSPLFAMNHDQIYTNIDVSRENHSANINGKEMPLSYFFNMINQ